MEVFGAAVEATSEFAHAERSGARLTFQRLPIRAFHPVPKPQKATLDTWIFKTLFCSRDRKKTARQPIWGALGSAEFRLSPSTRMGSYDTANEILDRVYPTSVFRPQECTNWQGEFPLPDAVVEYFREFGPVDVTIDGYGNHYFLPSLSQLWSFQAGYRYHPETPERFTGWDDDWLVIADQGGDPFIFSRASSIILHAFHGEGVWKPTQMFDSLAEMATTFAIIGDIVASAGRALTDDDSLILPRYRDAVRIRIGEFLHSHERANTLVSSLGWE
jgi:hypothetical protein